MSNIDTQFKKGHKPTHGFKKGMTPWNKGKPFLAMKGNKIRLGSKQSPETIEKRVSKLRGKNHWRWIEDKTKLSRINKQGERRTSAYFYWRKEVWTRDSFKCRLNGNDCSGRLEAHHILSWTEYPELRYIINNGITLCQAHHPRKRAEEKRMIPIFQELLSVSEE